jgi:hypothetical protein
MHITAMTFPLRQASLALALSSLACAAWAQQAPAEAPSVTPYRPSVSTPAALSAPGYLEVEAGGLHANAAGGAQRDSLPYTLKLAFSEDWGLRFGGEALVRQTDGAGGRISGLGDSSLVAKRRFAVNDRSAFGLELGATLATGKTGISSGHTDWSLNGIYSADLGAFHTDLNLMTTRLGAADVGASRGQVLWAASLSRALDERWGVVGELSGTHQRGADGSSQALVAASYNLSKALTLDFGVSRSLRSGVSDHSVFGGLTVLGPKLF